MGVSVAEYYGQRTDVDNPIIQKKRYVLFHLAILVKN